VCNDPAQLPFHREFSWHVPLPLDIEAMERAAPLLLGTKDFSAFTNMRYEDPFRTLTAIAIEPLAHNRLLFRIQGENFLYKMVRNLVGTLIYIGLGKIALEEFPLIITSKDRKLSGITAPAHGLFLHRVFY
jgi:tRNA pseudouridine38-40 synthase